MQSLSLNEFNTLLKRAARGVGMEWGYAEMFAQLCIMLIKQPLMGNVEQSKIVNYCVLFLQQLNQTPAWFVAPDATQIHQGLLTVGVEKRDKDKVLNPVIVACILSDFEWKNTSLKITNIGFPALLLPIVHQYIGEVDAKQWAEVKLSDMIIDFCATSNIKRDKPSTVSRVFISKDELNQLNQLMLQMCVPESELSLKDAGS